MKKTSAALISAVLTLLLAAAIIINVRPVPEAAPSPTPAPEPTPTPALTSQELAAELLAGMSDEEKVWQMMYVFPQDVCGNHCCTDLEVWADALKRYPVGGIVANSENMQSAEQLKTMLSCIKAGAATAVFTGVDEEGGAVARLAYTLGITTDFRPMYYYREDGTDTAFNNALTIAGDISTFGFNQDFAPVADVWTNSENTVIGTRAYSDDPEEAAELVAAAVRGFSKGGVVSTLKHFPGHGSTAEDSHYSTAVSDKTKEELYQCELLPFLSGIEAGAGMIMTGHITMSAIDPDHPATLSKAVVTGFLREELGWDGVVITDSFKMAAIADNYDQCQAAVMAVEAGCDMILGPDDPQAVVLAILEQVEPERIDDSVLRILTLKLEQGIIAAP